MALKKTLSTMISFFITIRVSLKLLEDANQTEVYMMKYPPSSVLDDVT